MWIRRMLRAVVWIAGVTALAIAIAWGGAILALRDLDRAVAEGDVSRPLSWPKSAALFVASQIMPLRQPAGAGIAQGRVFRDCTDCPEMVEIPPGVFLIGSPLFESGRYDHVKEMRFGRRAIRNAIRESPRRLVRIGHPFALGRYEATFAEWNRAQAAPDWEQITGRPARPIDCAGCDPAAVAVTGVDRHDADAYAAWISARTGAHYRLPSEAEWEYAARAGAATAYPWGDEVGTDNAACVGCSTLWDEREVGPVGLHPPNRFGLYDIIGNGTEWVADCFVPWHSAAIVDGSPYIFDGCEFAVFKGGTAHARPWQARSAMRVGPHPNNAGEGSTIRLLRELDTP